jgi:hypothetical protein
LFALLHALPKQFILWDENKTCSLQAVHKENAQQRKEERGIKFHGYKKMANEINHSRQGEKRGSDWCMTGVLAIKPEV